jgi:hypothetical protein
MSVIIKWVYYRSKVSVSVAVFKNNPVPVQILKMDLIMV